MKTSNWRTMREAHFGAEDSLPKGSYVVPVSDKFVPDSVRGQWIGMDGYVFCYTRLGFKPIAENNLEEC